MKIFAIGMFLLFGQNSVDQTTQVETEKGNNYLHLVCIGGGGANKEDRTSFYDSQNNNWADAVGNKSVPFQDQVNIRFNTEQSWLRMPQVMLPTLKGGKGGWFKIKSLEFGEEEIKGRVAVNAINRPKFRIDRITGAISMNGRASTYSGNCARYDPKTVKKAF